VIQPLRSAHRVVFFVWSGFLPVLLALALATRHRIPEAGPAKPAAGGEAFLVRPVRGAEGSILLEIVAANPATPPDLLVYWTSQQAAATLPADARLLGAYRREGRYALPAGTASGYLALYSLAHQETVASLRLEIPR